MGVLARPDERGFVGRVNVFVKCGGAYCLNRIAPTHRSQVVRPLSTNVCLVRVRHQNCIRDRTRRRGGRRRVSVGVGSTGVSVGVSVGVGDSVSVGVAVGVSVGVGDAVAVAVGVGEALGVGVSVVTTSLTPISRFPESNPYPPACIQYVVPLTAENWSWEVKSIAGLKSSLQSI